MEYAEENLSQIIPQRPLTTGEAREVAVSAVDALLFLHEKGLVHRSLRLSNVMAAGDQLKLSSDCVGPADESGKQPGQASAYDPMEEASGTASRAGDAWSFGVMLCQSLTQRVPVQKTGQEDPAVPPLPAPFADIVRQSLRRDPQSRWTVRDIADELSGRKPAAQAPVSRPEPQAPAMPMFQESPQWRSWEFSKTALVFAVVIIALVAFAVVGGTKLLRQSRETKQRAASLEQQARQAKAEQPLQKPAAGISAKNRHMQAVAAVTPTPESSYSSSNAGIDTPATVKEQKVVRRVVPHVPQSARNTIQGTVRVKVKVRVARSGKVSTAKLVSPGPSKYFARLAMQAALRWKFSAASEDERESSREWILPFEFKRSGTRVAAVISR